VSRATHGHPQGWFRWDRPDHQAVRWGLRQCQRFAGRRAAV